MDISLLHHWLVSLRGGEKVLEQLCHLFPSADIHTLVRTHNKEELGQFIPQHHIHTTGLDLIPGAEYFYKSLLPLFPFFINHHKVDADFVISSDAALIKGLKVEEGVPHVCYCHSPPRYLWDMQEEYLKSMNSIKREVFKWVTPHLRKFDLAAAHNVDHFIANSTYVQDRIKRIYGRQSEVIHPPVALNEFTVSEDSQDFYLIVSALVPYKRIDIAIQAFNRLGSKLVVIGKGSELPYLKSIAKDNIEILGAQPFEVLKEYYRECKAFIFPGIEDFGITPLEAQACGKPVIAMKEGGALETIIEEETGIFFEKQTPDDLIEAVERFEAVADNFSPSDCRRNATNFSPSQFRFGIKSFLRKAYPSYFSDFLWGDEQQSKSVSY